MSISQNSATAVLLAWEEESGKKLPTPIKSAIKAHVDTDARVPALSAQRAACERDLAKRSTDADDIRELAAQVKKGTAAEDLTLGPKSEVVAAQALAESERLERTIKRCAVAAGDTVGDFARSSRKLLSDVEATWRDDVHHNLDRDENSYRAVADADRLADRLATRIHELIVVLDQPHGKYHSALLRDKVKDRPQALPRLAPLLAVIEDEKRGVEQAAAASQIKRDNFRAAADGRVVSGPMKDVDKAAVARSAQLRTGRDKSEVSK